MKKYLLPLALCTCMVASAQQLTVTSPDGRIRMEISNGKQLTYQVTYNGQTMVEPSVMGFELKGEKPMGGDFKLMETPVVQHKTVKLNPQKPLVIDLAGSGGYVAIIK